LPAVLCLVGNEHDRVAPDAVVDESFERDGVRSCCGDPQVGDARVELA